MFTLQNMSLNNIEYNELEHGFVGRLTYLSLGRHDLAIIKNEIGNFDITIPKEINNLLFIKSIFIEDKFRNKGYGHAIVSKLKQKNDFIILMADIHRYQSANFNLIKFYENLGFYQIPSDFYYPIMIWIKNYFLPVSGLMSSSDLPKNCFEFSS